MIKVKVITAPSVEPWLLASVKTLMSIPDTQSDTALTSYIKSARLTAEKFLNRKLITQTLELALQDFSDSMELPYGPVQSITSAKYDDEDGTEQTVTSTNYDLDTYGPRHYCRAAYDYTWPSVRPHHNNVRIRYVAGYGNAGSDVPEDIMQAQLILIGHWLRFQKEAESGIGPTRIPRQFYDLLTPYKVVDF